MITNTTNRTPTYLFLSKNVKDGLRRVAKYNHTTLSHLLEEGANLIIHDPKVSEDQIFSELGIKPRHEKSITSLNMEEGTWIKENSLEKSLVNVDAILILTEWEIYKEIKWEKVEKIIRKPCWVFDTRSIINFNEIKNTDLNFWRIGDGIIKS